MSQPPQEQPEVTPGVRTAPAGSAWSRIPDHLGRARTSTVVLAVLFLAIFALYLNIRPNPTPVTAGTGSTAPVQTPAPATEPPASTTPAPETTTEGPTTSDGPTTSGGSTDLSTPTGTPSGTGSTTAVPVPPPAPSATVTSPTG